MRGTDALAWPVPRRCIPPGTREARLPALENITGTVQIRYGWPASLQLRQALRFNLNSLTKRDVDHTLDLCRKFRILLVPRLAGTLMLAAARLRGSRISH
jgi:hypothetical protein